MTSGAVGPDRARAAAAAAIASGPAAIAAAREGRLLDPVAIRDPAGDTAGWVVGLASGETLIGLIQIEADGRYRRFASFQRRAGTLDGCPPVADWFDPPTIRERAEALAGAGERLGTLVLTYDGNPDRLAWAVETTSPAGERSRILVAGAYAYRSPT